MHACAHVCACMRVDICLCVSHLAYVSPLTYLSGIVNISLETTTRAPGRSHACPAHSPHTQCILHPLRFPRTFTRIPCAFTRIPCAFTRTPCAFTRVPRAIIVCPIYEYNVTEKARLAGDVELMNELFAETVSSRVQVFEVSEV